MSDQQNISTVKNGLDSLLKILTPFKPIIKSKYALKIITDILFEAYTVLIVFSFSLRYWNILSWFQILPLPLFASTFSESLNRGVVIGLILWVSIQLILYYLLNYADDTLASFQTDDLVLWAKTASDLIGLLVAIIFFLFATNELLLFANHGESGLENSLVVCFIYYATFFISIILLIQKAFEGNKECEARYTDYYDCNKKRIAIGDRVIYYNRLYLVRIAPDNPQNPYIVPAHYDLNPNKILLESAVRDKEGYLMKEPAI